MSFLELNGWSVSPAIGGRVNNTRIGNDVRTYQGRTALDTIADKNRWRFSSTFQSELKAEMLRGVMLSRGQSWPFDADAYSYTGLGPNSSAQYTIFDGEAGDGDHVANVVKFGGGSVAVDDATTNILPADSRDAENAPTGYRSYGTSTLAVDTANYYQGAKSVKTTANSLSLLNGIYTDAASASNGDVVYGSVYLKASAASQIVAVRIYDVANAVLGTPTSVTISTTQWTRVSCSHTMTANSADVAVLIVGNEFVGVSRTYYADAWQLEIGKHTSWVDGTRATADQLVYERIGWLQKSNISISFWTDGPQAGTSQTLWQFGADANNFIELLATGQFGANTCVLRTRIAGADTDITQSSAWDGSMHHIAATIRYNPETGEFNRSFWFDGVSVGTSSAGTLPDQSTFTDMSVGCNILAGNQCDCLIDDLVVVPFPIFDDVVDAWYNFGKSIAILPYWYADGDFNDGEVVVRGQYNGKGYRVFANDGVTRINGSIVDFELLER